MDMGSRVPELRVVAGNTAGVNPGGAYVLYWMIAARRTEWNWALQRAVEWARHLGRPLVVLEALRAGYPFASDRLHTFVVQGMADTARRLAGRRVGYFPYVESRHGEGTGLLESLARDACLVVTDLFPAFFLPRMVSAAASRLPVLLEQVDGCGLLPLAVVANRALPTAFAFRRVLQQDLREHLRRLPAADPLDGPPLAMPPALPAQLVTRWPAATPEMLAGAPSALTALAIDHSVPPVAGTPGGATAAQRVLERFLTHGLPSYDELRNHPDHQVTSGLSPFLHFGHLSAAEVFAAVARREGWSPDRLSDRRDGRRAGWWGMSAASEAFLDQLVTWRELGYTFAAARDDWEEFEALPPWARRTLEEHAADSRPNLYSLHELATAATHDEVWNAAQRQLLTEGVIHNYLRMLWGKKILEWTRHPREALAAMLELNNRFALDGRDPNSTSGITWCLGRFDRPWGPIRPVFGTVRYMSSQNTVRKVRMRHYLERFRG